MCYKGYKYCRKLVNCKKEFNGEAVIGFFLFLDNI